MWPRPILSRGRSSRSRRSRLSLQIKVESQPPRCKCHGGKVLLNLPLSPTIVIGITASYVSPVITFRCLRRHFHAAQFAPKGRLLIENIACMSTDAGMIFDVCAIAMAWPGCDYPHVFNWTEPIESLMEASCATMLITEPPATALAGCWGSQHYSSQVLL